MKQIFSVFLTLSLQAALLIGVQCIWTPAAHAQKYVSQTFKGYVGNTSTTFYFSPHMSGDQGYTIETNTTDVQDSLNRLSEGDYITGNGFVDENNKKIRIDSIQYVGLRRLLGPWKSDEGLMVFKDFTTMRFFPNYTDQPQGVEATNHQQEFRYSLSPSNSGAWILFLSDSKSTTFATVEFDSANILLKIFESESGNILRTLILERP